MAIKVKTEDSELEVSEEQLVLPEGYAIITPDRVPDGYFSEDAVQKRIKERIKNTAENAKQEVLESKEYDQRILSKYGISLGDDGKPKGVKPDVDIDEVKKNVAESVKKEYEDKFTKQLTEKEERLSKFLSRSFESSVLKAGNKIGFDEKYFEPLVEGGKPYLKTELESHFKYNDEIDDFAQVDKDGSFVVDGNGFVSVERFLDKNKERYSHMLKDNRQTGSNFRKAGGGNSVNGGKKKSEYSNEERAELFAKWRNEGKKPLEEWDKVPS